MDLLVLSLKIRKTLNPNVRETAPEKFSSVQFSSVQSENTNTRPRWCMLMNVDETNGEISESRSTRFPAGRRGAFSGGAARRIASYWAQ